MRGLLEGGDLVPSKLRPECYKYMFDKPKGQPAGLVTKTYLDLDLCSALVVVALAPLLL
jgi:hypothetical protein